MAITEARTKRSSSAAFQSIRRKVQAQMKKQQVTYSDVLEAMKKDSNER
ncbi:hypothetical protein V1498_10090 [Peribacillus sp. SCS-26]